MFLFSSSVALGFRLYGTFLNCLNRILAQYISLPSQVESVFTFPVKDRALMRQLNLHNLEDPDRTLYNI